MPLLLRERGDEDDRDVLGALALLYQLRELEAVDLGHLDVEQDAGEVVVQELAERGGGRGDGYQPLAERLEGGGEREQVLLAVVDEQDVRAVAHPQPAFKQAAVVCFARAFQRLQPG